MNLPPIPVPALLAAALPDHPRLLDSIVYQVNGLIVVFAALSLIWGMLEVMGFYFRRVHQAPAPAPAPAVVAVPASFEGITPEQVAAISAAVTVLFGTPHRIQAIVPADPELNWAQEGRRQIFASHRTR
ncbi:MAG: OadG family transporter subunit [Lacunisphaera sp.]|nr:OadG family transporter subunit [Lacunisphaera sp.]